MISYFLWGYIIKIDFSFLVLPEKKIHNFMSYSNDFDWSIIVLIGFLIFGGILIMMKLTIGSCYKPPEIKDRKFM